MITSLETPTLEFLRLVELGYNPFSDCEYPGDYTNPNQLLKNTMDAGLVERLDGKKVKSLRLTQKGTQYAEMM
jgi:hypothetical protein